MTRSAKYLRALRNAEHARRTRNRRRARYWERQADRHSSTIQQIPAPSWMPKLLDYQRRIFESAEAMLLYPASRTRRPHRRGMTASEVRKIAGIEPSFVFVEELQP